MFRDIKLSKDIQAEFEEHLTGKDGDSLICGVDFKTEVL